MPARARRASATAPIGVDVDVPETLPRGARRRRRCSSGRVANLVDNALRVVAAGRSRCASRPGAVGDRVDLRVIDHGPGIPPAERERVFQPFQRLGDHARNGAGVGLGLAVARGFVEAMGGELPIEDTPGGGTHRW